MNILTTRDYHEVIGDIIPMDIPEDLSLGNSLLPRIPQQQELICNEEEEEKQTSVKLTKIEIMDLLPRINFNLPEEPDARLIEKMLISQGDYWGLYSIYKDQYPFKLLNSFVLYGYCRTLVNKPLTKGEYNKIQNDIRCIKKQSKIIEKRKLKKNKGKYRVEFK